MRDLLRSTQDEVDRIIQGTNSIQEVYTESQQFVSQTASNPGSKPSGLQSAASSAQIVGGKVIKEVSLNAANLNSLQREHEGVMARELLPAATIQQQSFISGLQPNDLLLASGSIVVEENERPLRQ